MKNVIYITLISLFYSITSCAQTKFAVGKGTFKTEKFNVTRSSIVTNNQRSWFISPEKNKYNGPVPPPKDNYHLSVQKSDIHVDVQKVKDIFNDVLKEKIKALHEQKESIGIIFIFETNGAIADASYTLQEKTLITPAEIEQIDNMLRQNIKVTFTGPDYKYYQAVNYAFPYIKF